MINRVDLGVAAVLLCVCGWLYYVTTTFDAVSPLFAQDLPPELFPRMLLWLIAAFALAVPFERWMRKERGTVLDAARRVPIKPIAYLSGAFLVIGVVAIDWIGTYLSLILICFGLPVLWGERRLKVLVPYALIFPTVVVAMLSKLLGVRFERGVLDIDLF